MKKLTKEEAAEIKKAPDGKAGYVRGVLLAMEPGEIILLETADWTQRTQVPSSYCLKLARKTGKEWKCEKALDGSGWVLERIR